MEVTIGLMFTEPQAKEKCSLAHDSKQVRLLISRSSLSVDISYNNGYDAAFHAFMATWSGKVSTNNTAAILLFYFTLMINKKMFFRSKYKI